MKAARQEIALATRAADDEADCRAGDLAAEDVGVDAAALAAGK